jgi:hypothetical protein
VPPESVVRILGEDSRYAVDVEMVRDEHGRPRVTGVAVRTLWPTKRRGDPPWRTSFPAGSEPPAVSTRDVRRMPLATYVRAAVAIASSEAFPLERLMPARRGELARRLRRALPPDARPDRTTEFYRRVLEEVRALERSGVPAPATELARRMGVPPNRVHQWLFRARRLEGRGR